MLLGSVQTPPGDALLTGVTFFRLQPNPVVVVILAMGLAGTEESPYCVDMLNKLPNTWTIVTVRGYECCHGGGTDKFFVKNDTTRIRSVYSTLKKVFPSKPIVGLGMSLGGALLLQSSFKKEIDLDCLIMI